MLRYVFLIFPFSFSFSMFLTSTPSLTSNSISLLPLCCRDFGLSMLDVEIHSIPNFGQFKFYNLHKLRKSGFYCGNASMQVRNFGLV